MEDLENIPPRDRRWRKMQLNSTEMRRAKLETELNLIQHKTEATDKQLTAINLMKTCQTEKAMEN